MRNPAAGDRYRFAGAGCVAAHYRGGQHVGEWCRLAMFRIDDFRLDAHAPSRFVIQTLLIFRRAVDCR